MSAHPDTLVYRPWQPIGTLDAEGHLVQMRLRNGKIVEGWLSRRFQTRPRSYWSMSQRGWSELVDAVAWQEVPCPVVLDAPANRNSQQTEAAA